MTDQKAHAQLQALLAHLQGKHGPIVTQGVGHELLPRYQGGAARLHERRVILFKDGSRAVLTRPPGGAWS